MYFFGFAMCLSDWFENGLCHFRPGTFELPRGGWEEVGAVHVFDAREWFAIFIHAHYTREQVKNRQVNLIHQFIM